MCHYLAGEVIVIHYQHIAGCQSLYSYILSPRLPTLASLLPFLSFEFFFFFFFFLCGFFFYDDDGDMDTRTLFDDFLMKEILAGRFDDFLMTNFLTIFLFEDLSGRRTSRYRRRPGLSSPWMPLLVFWPHAGAWGAGVIFLPCAQLLWCELYVMKSIQKKNRRHGICHCHACHRGGFRYAAVLRRCRALNRVLSRRRRHQGAAQPLPRG